MTEEQVRVQAIKLSEKYKLLLRECDSEACELNIVSCSSETEIVSHLGKMRREKSEISRNIENRALLCLEVIQNQILCEYI